MAVHFEDRESLYRVISDGQPLYVRAASFKEAMEKFLGITYLTTLEKNNE